MWNGPQTGWAPYDSSPNLRSSYGRIDRYLTDSARRLPSFFHQFVGLDNPDCLLGLTHHLTSRRARSERVSSSEMPQVKAHIEPLRKGLSRASLEARQDLAVLREATFALLREDQLTVGEDVELALRAWCRLGGGLSPLLDLGHETRGPAVVAASGRAVQDLDRHRGKNLPVAQASTRGRCRSTIAAVSTLRDSVP